VRRITPALLCLFLFLSAPVYAQSTGTEVVRGRVLSPEKEPLAEALVTVTALGSLTRRSTHTNERGLYTVLFSSGEGEYLVSVSAIGFAPMSGRVRRTGESNVLIADVILSRAVLQLDSVTVVARRPGAPGGDSAGIGAHERDVLPGALFSLDPSALDALMAQVPGLAAVPGLNGPGGYSVLGASPDQNSVLLDGTRFDGKALPPGVIGAARVATTTYNPSRGNFAGGQLALTTRAGGDRFQSSVGGELVDPRLAWNDPNAPTPLARSATLTGAASGPILRGTANYNFGFSQNVQSSELFSLLSLNDVQREQQGLAQDTIARLGSTLAGLGVPLTSNAIPDRSTTRNRSALLRVDLVPSATTTLTVSTAFGDSRQLGAGISPTGFPSLAGTSRSRNLRGQAELAAYVHGLLDRFTTSLQSTATAAGPLLSMPNGTVRVDARYPDGRNGLTQLAFGGATAGTTSSRSRQLEMQNELSWLTTDSRQQLSFGQSISFDRTTASDAANRFGTFTYQSSDDLAANHPASYARTFSSSARSTATTTSALWVGGTSRLRRGALELQYGLRMDLSRVGTVPEYNPALDSLFDRRTDRVPRSVGLSPRLGFSWTPSRPRAGAWGALPVTISGGIGAFRGVVPAGRIIGLADATGLPSSIRQLTCVGDATPIPDWTAFTADPDAAPTACLDGGGPAEFATDVPSAQLFDPSYRPPTSWRGNLAVGGLRPLGWPLGLSGTYSRTLNVESAVDLNLRRAPVFTLPSEGGRPVFVSPEGIVPTTGAVAPGGSRLTERFGSVTSYLSDLESRAVEFQVQLSAPRPLFGKLPLQLSYTFNDVRQQERGLDGSTDGDPWAQEWARGAQPTHQFGLATSFGIPYASVTLQMNLVSGTPYTPMVAGDVNGDGRQNDRAFILDPAATGDSAAASQMRELLGSATSGTRACLEAQLGRIAGRNSCRGGWRLQPNMNLNLQLPWQSFGFSGLGERLHLSVNTQNAMGALVRLMGLSNTAIGRASGTSYPIDPTLLYVDGFDPATQRFRYRVNQQFGEGHPQRFRSSRYAGAFQVQIGARIELGAVTRRPSMVRDLGFVSADRELPPPTEAEVRERLRKLTMDPVSMLLQLRDSLLLSDAQIERLEAERAGFERQADSLMAPMVAYVVRKGQNAKDKDFAKLLGKARKAMFPLMLEALHRGVEELREEQKKRLPAGLRAAAEASSRVRKP
jgi:hypothetical protein